MTNTATRPAEGRTTGPLRTVWGAAMSPEALVRSLLPPEAALPVPAAGDAVWARAAESGALLAVREQAEAELGTPWPQPLASQYARYFRDGNRTGYESQVFERQDRLTRAVLMALASGADGWLDEAADGIVQLCEQSSWCWPAHEDTCRPRGTVLPDLATPCLDLGAADVAAQLAWADQVLGDRLASASRGCASACGRRCARGCSTRSSGGATGTGWGWTAIPATGAHGSAATCSSPRCAWPSRARSGRTRSPWPWRASITTWRRCRVTAPSTRATNTGGTGHAARSRRSTSWSTPRRGGSTRRRSRSCGRRSNSRTACIWAGRGTSTSPTLGPGRPLTSRGGCRTAGLAGSACTTPAGTRRRSARPGFRPPPSWGGRSASWSTWSGSGAGPGEPPLVAGVWLPGTQVGLARTTGGTARGLTLAIKGGHNGEHHNHNDVGSVVVAVDGVPVLVDAGRPTYTAQTFGPDRYAIWTMRSSWHNVPEIRGTQQGQGRRFRARDVEVVDEPGRFEAGLDLARRLPVPELRAVVAHGGARPARVTRDDRGRLELHRRRRPERAALPAGRAGGAAVRRAGRGPAAGRRARPCSWRGTPGWRRPRSPSVHWRTRCSPRCGATA